RPRYSGSCSQREAKIRDGRGLRRGGGLDMRWNAALRKVRQITGVAARCQAAGALDWSTPDTKRIPPMIDLHYWPTPNGHKITLLLEELAEAGQPLEYALKPVDIGAGDQFKPEFLAISPNNKM